MILFYSRAMQFLGSQRENNKKKGKHYFIHNYGIKAMLDEFPPPLSFSHPFIWLFPPHLHTQRVQ